MKKSLVSWKSLTILMAILIFFPYVLFPAITPILSISPYFQYDSSPVFDSYEIQEPKNWETKQDMLWRFEQRPAVAALGFDWHEEHFRGVMRIEIREELQNALTHSGYSNIPYIGNTQYVVTNAMYPQLGFVEFNYNNLLISLGRRQIKWGPGRYNFSISDSQPYLDNLWISYDTKAGPGRFGYNFVTVGFSNVALNGSGEPTAKNKFLFAHRFSWGTDYLRISLDELNMVYCTIPSLLDFSPFIVWHNIYQEEHSNVMIELTAEGRIQNFRLYGSFAMDDFHLPTESSTDYKPTAMGFMLGLEYQCLPGSPRVHNVASNQEFLLAEKTLQQEGGLKIFFEGNIATNYLYNRRKQGDTGKFENDWVGKFTVPWRYYSSNGGMKDVTDAYFLGFPYGPGSWLFELGVQYENSDWTMEGVVGCLLRGTSTIDEDIMKDDIYESWFMLKPPLRTLLLFQTDVNYSINQCFSLSSGFRFVYDFLDKRPDIQCRLGVCYSFF